MAGSYAVTAAAPLILLLFLTLRGTLAVQEKYFVKTVYAQAGTMSGPNRTEVATVSVNPPTWFGSFHMRDRPIADNPAIHGNIVGRVMDASFKVVDSTEHNFYTYMILVFQDDSRYICISIHICLYVYIQYSNGLI